VRQSVEVVDGAVDRVDDPGESARTLYRGALLAEHPVVGAGVLDTAQDESFDLAIGFGDDIHDRRLRRRHLDALAAPAGGQLPGFESDRTGEVEEVGHASSLGRCDKRKTRADRIRVGSARAFRP
jgi:hypothetical protein